MRLQDHHDASDHGAMATTTPPQHPTAAGGGLVVVGATFHYLGPSFAVLLFAHLDVMGVAWLRMATAALVLALFRPPWPVWRAAGREERVLVVVLGGVLAVMNATFYLALDRLPLATVAGIEFLGVIALAAYGARTRRNACALALTIAGVALLIHGAHRRHPDRAAAGRRELPWLHALRRRRPPARQHSLGAPHRRPRPAQPGGGHRGHRCDPARHRGCRPRTPAPDVAALGARRRRLLDGHPLPHRPAGDGPAAARDVQPHARAAPGHRHRVRRRAAAPAARPSGPGRARAGRRGRRHPSSAPSNQAPHRARRPH